MKYTERMGHIENIYEGTVAEIVDLYDKMNFKKKFTSELVGSCKPIKEIKENNPCQPLDTKPTVKPNINVYCEASADKIANEIAKNLSKSIYKIVGI